MRFAHACPNSLQKLIVSPQNVRVVTPSKPADAQLMASILADGILQNLVVINTEAGDDTFEVIAGGRRLAAVARHIEAGKFSDDYELPCLIKSRSDATALSMAENICRENMHPADVFLAYKALADSGRTEKEIAKRFGDSTTQVKNFCGYQVLHLN